MRKIILVGFSLQSVEGLKAMSQWEQKREISPGCSYWPSSSPRGTKNSWIVPEGQEAASYHCVVRRTRGSSGQCDKEHLLSCPDAWFSFTINHGDRTQVSLRAPECLQIQVTFDLGQVCGVLSNYRHIMTLGFNFLCLSLVC